MSQMVNQASIDFLKLHPLFRSLDEGDEIYDLALICKVTAYRKGDFVAHQGEIADRLYIVRKGEFESYKVGKDGVISQRRLYKTQEFFKDEWLFTKQVHGATVLAREDGEIWTITEEDFYHFLEDHPGVTLHLSEQGELEKERSGVSETKSTIQRLNLTLDEHLLYESRRTAWLLLFELSFPIALMLLLPGLLYPVMVATPLNQVRLLVPSLTFILFLIPFLWMIYRYIDWANDHLTITDKYLRHREFDLRRFSGVQKTIPIDKIQGIGTNRPTFIESRLKIGTVTVKTASLHGNLVFDKLTNPEEVEKTISSVRNRGRQFNEGRMREDVRKVLEGELHVPIRRPAAITRPEDDPRKRKKRRKQRIQRRGNRFEVDGGIIYGRHSLVLFWKVWWVILLIAVTAGSGYLLWRYVPAAQIPFTIVAVGFVLAIELFIYYYFYDDWKNDIFQLTGDSVIDVDRTAFGFTENRKVARLVDVQNVNVEQPNVWAALFNYGDVTIDTAGASGNIVFEDVAEPDKVQTDILERRERLIYRQRSRSAVSRRREIAIMIDYYQKLREQQRIQERTPDLDEHFGDDSVS